MSAATLAPAADGGWRVAGTLDFDTVAGLWPQLDELIGRGDELALSLAEVEQTNSAGVALLLEARGAAERSGCRLLLRDLPRDLLDLARMSGCEALIVDAAG